MPENRYFLEGELAPQQEGILDEKESHHLMHVMRKKVGDVIELVNGNGVLGTASVLSPNKKSVVLKIETAQKKPSSSSVVTIAQAIPRFSRLETILEKGTELGMDEIWLFPSERSEKKEFSKNQKERIRHITVSAMKQCGRLYLPRVSLMPPLLTWQKKELKGALYFGDLNPEAPLFGHVYKKSPLTTFFVGPEAGFSDKELAHLLALGAKGVQLSSHILRTDTASMVALSLMQL